MRCTYKRTLIYAIYMVAGVYGALEVLYAGIVAEIPCKENMHRLVCLM